MSQGNETSLIDGPVEISTQVMPASASTVPLPAPVGGTLIIHNEGTPPPPKFEKLRDDNWFAWKTRMSIVLRRYGALEVATGSVEKPEDSESAARWNSRDFIARELIAASIKDEQVIHISGCETSAEMWGKLRTVHEPNVVSIIATKKKLYTTVASEAADLVEHINELKRLRNQLSLAGCLIAENEFKLILVSSFPPSWEGFTAPFFRFQNISFTSQELASILCDEYRRRKEEAYLQDMGT